MVGCLLKSRLVEAIHLGQMQVHKAQVPVSANMNPAIEVSGFDIYVHVMETT